MPKKPNNKVKFGTTLPADMPAKLRQYAEREGMFIDEIFASALEAWFESMDGRGVFKPTNLEHHRRLETLLNAKDPAVLEALRGVLALCERAVTTGS